MSMILICRKLLEVNLKPKLSTVFGRFKIHTNGGYKVLLVKENNPYFLFKRPISQWFRKPKKANLKIIDNIPDQYELIYRNTLERYIFYTQLGTTITTVIIVLTLLITYGSPKGKFKFYGHTEDLMPSSSSDEVHICLAIFFTTVVLLQLLISKMPLRIYYLSQQKKYVFMLPSSLPLQTKRLGCKVGEVEKLPVKGFLPLKEAQFRIKRDKTVILLEEHFRKPADLYVMMGIQRDPDDDL